MLGFLSEDNFLGGRMRLDAGKARQAVERVAKPLGMSVEDAAAGIIRIIDVKMEEAIKAISTMRGHDLRDFMLLAFGGAGPLHAGRIARDLGMARHRRAALSRRLFRHRAPDVRRQARLRAVAHDADARAFARTTSTSMFARLEAQATADLRADGFAADKIRIERGLDLRYAGQGYEITMPCPRRRR